MNEIKYTLKFKNNKVEKSEFYLGASLKREKLNGEPIWTMSSMDDLKAAINNVAERLHNQEGERLPIRAAAPMTQSYRPDIDDSE